MPLIPKIKRSFRLPRGYKRLKCNTGNYQCGMRCQSEDLKCHKNANGVPKSALEWSKYVTEQKLRTERVQQGRRNAKNLPSADDHGIVSWKANPNYKPAQPGAVKEKAPTKPATPAPVTEPKPTISPTGTKLSQAPKKTAPVAEPETPAPTKTAKAKKTKPKTEYSAVSPGAVEVGSAVFFNPQKNSAAPRGAKVLSVDQAKGVARLEYATLDGKIRQTDRPLSALLRPSGAVDTPPVQIPSPPTESAQGKPFDKNSIVGMDDSETESDTNKIEESIKKQLQGLVEPTKIISFLNGDSDALTEKAKKVLLRKIAGAKYLTSSDHKSLQVLSALGRTSKTVLARMDSEDPNKSIGDFIDFKDAKSFTGQDAKLLSGEGLSVIRPEKGGVIYVIKKPLRGLDIPYDAIAPDGAPMLSHENETIVSGKYKIVSKQRQKVSVLNEDLEKDTFEITIYQIDEVANDLDKKVNKFIQKPAPSSADKPTKPAPGKGKNPPKTYLLWATKKGDPDWKESLITETESPDQLQKALKWAEENGFDRIRQSEFNGEQPDFIGAVSAKPKVSTPVPAQPQTKSGVDNSPKSPKQAPKSVKERIEQATTKEEVMALVKQAQKEAEQAITSFGKELAQTAKQIKSDLAALETEDEIKSYLKELAPKITARKSELTDSIEALRLFDDPNIESRVKLASDDLESHFRKLNRQGYLWSLETREKITDAVKKHIGAIPSPLAKFRKDKAKPEPDQPSADPLDDIDWDQRVGEYSDERLNQIEKMLDKWSQDDVPSTYDGWASAVKDEQERRSQTGAGNSPKDPKPAPDNDPIAPLRELSKIRVDDSTPAPGAPEKSQETALKIGTKQVNFPKPLAKYTALRLDLDYSAGWGIVDQDGDLLRAPLAADGKSQPVHRFRERSAAENFANKIMARVSRELKKQAPAPKETPKTDKVRIFNKPITRKTAVSNVQFYAYRRNTDAISNKDLIKEWQNHRLANIALRYPDLFPDGKGYTSDHQVTLAQAGGDDYARKLAALLNDRGIMEDADSSYYIDFDSIKAAKKQAPAPSKSPEPAPDKTHETSQAGAGRVVETTKKYSDGFSSVTALIAPSYGKEPQPTKGLLIGNTFIKKVLNGYYEIRDLTTGVRLVSGEALKKLTGAGGIKSAKEVAKVIHGSGLQLSAPDGDKEAFKQSHGALMDEINRRFDGKLYKKD